MSELDGQINAHITLVEEEQIKALAALEDMKASEYVRKLLIAHLDEKNRQYKRMQRIFSSSNSTQSTHRTQGSGD